MSHFRHSSALTRTTTPAAVVRIARRPFRLFAGASALVLASVAFATDAIAASLYAFGQATVSSPGNATPGTVVARHYFTPQDVCGASTCQITGIRMYSKGGVWVSDGPDLETNVSGLSTRMLVDGNVAVSSTKATLRNTLEVTLFRDSRQPQDGSLNSGALSAYYSIEYKSGIFGASSPVFLAAKVSFINGTCSIPDQTVTLPPVQHHVFKGVGSTAAATDFQVQLNNCPAGYNRIGYQLAPLDDMVTGSPGGMQLRPDATASGIGIQIADAATGQPLPLSKSHTVTSYNPATGGSPSIRLRASYLQTGAKVGGGSVHAAAQVLLDYQ
ncbi:fimbrial protein [Burkholderia lata]|uniref:Fimbrial protein n=1 Tax=Burkholderia lata (strain ATCC 17760 / DSM 23089 / LMG 22485 / NCIMB 9086 / R18194 / 383) TaxID=482957 RepID=A0A6P3AB20_BURL3|nr:fimbrial protein [Burkholderia lata]VWD44053.1 fimbrial protein [Burkholderia lata]